MRFSHHSPAVSLSRSPISIFSPGGRTLGERGSRGEAGRLLRQFGMTANRIPRGLEYCGVHQTFPLKGCVLLCPGRLEHSDCWCFDHCRTANFIRTTCAETGNSTIKSPEGQNPAFRVDGRLHDRDLKIRKSRLISQRQLPVEQIPAANTRNAATPSVPFERTAKSQESESSEFYDDRRRRTQCSGIVEDCPCGSGRPELCNSGPSTLFEQ